MTNAFAHRPIDEFEDEFDLDLGYAPSAPDLQGGDALTPYAPAPHAGAG